MASKTTSETTKIVKGVIGDTATAAGETAINKQVNILLDKADKSNSDWVKARNTAEAIVVQSLGQRLLSAFKKWLGI